MASSLPVFSAADVSRVLTYEELFPALEAVLGEFSLKDDSRISQPVRQLIEIPQHNGYCLTMPCYITMGNLLVVKVITNFPDSRRTASFSAPVLLFNGQNGDLLSVMDGREITAMRTAAVSALSSKHLAPAESKVLAIIGAGVQARSHYYALKATFKFNEVRVYSRTEANAKKFSDEIGGKHCKNVEEAVRDADIIVTATSATKPVLNAEWVKPGVHINVVGACKYDQQEIDPNLMRSAEVYVESSESAKKESGDIILSKAEIYAEIGEVINGKKKGHKDHITVFKNLGMAVEDAVSAKLVFDKISAEK